MIINDKYEFRDKEGNELEPTKEQLITFITDELKNKDRFIEVIQDKFIEELRDHEEFCLETAHQTAIRDRALKLACEMVYQFDNSHGLWCFDIPLDEYYNTLDEEEVVRKLVEYFIMKAEQEEQQEQEEQIEQE